MAKICPDCNGDKYIEEFDERGVRKYSCRTCKGKGTIPDDKISRPESCNECKFYFDCRKGSIANACGGLECAEKWRKETISKDKIRDTEEIIEELENCFLGHDEYILGLLAELKKSKDPEIKKLRDEKTELKDTYAETFEEYIPADKLSEANDFLLSRFADYEVSKAIVKDGE